MISSDLINKRFGKLIVVEQKETSKLGRRRWLCLCDCGSTKIIQGRHLKNGDTKSCGCICNKSFKEISGSFICQIKSNAKKRNILYEVSNEQLWNQYILQNKRCALSGMCIDFVKNMSDRKTKQTASLDRIDSHKNYTIDNIQWIHKDINLMKNNMSKERFLDMVKLINYKTSTNHVELQTKVQVYKQHKNFRGCGNLPMNLYKSYIRGARLRDLEFNISIEECWELFIKQNGKCYFTNLDIKIHTRRSNLETTASLDRIDSSLGYFINNVRWVHKDINKMKWDISRHSFLYYCDLICKYNKI